LRLGRLDERRRPRTSASISGGTAGNIVPEWCKFLAEARCHDERRLNDLVRRWSTRFTFRGTSTDCEVSTEMRKTYRGIASRGATTFVRLAAARSSDAGMR